MVGAFMAGNVFNYEKHLYRRIELNDFEGEISDEELDKEGRSEEHTSELQSQFRIRMPSSA